MNNTGLRRLRALAAGVSDTAIAESEGVSLGAVRSSIHSAAYKLSRRATPGTELPVGCSWHDRGEDRTRGDRWYVSMPSTIKRPIALWCIALPAITVCEYCGRPL